MENLKLYSKITLKYWHRENYFKVTFIENLKTFQKLFLLKPPKFLKRFLKKCLKFLLEIYSDKKRSLENFKILQKLLFWTFLCSNNFCIIFQNEKKRWFNFSYSGKRAPEKTRVLHFGNCHGLREIFIKVRLLSLQQYT